VFCLFCAPAFGYIDPGTGSYMFQLLAAAFLTALFVIKMYWLKLITFFRSLFGRNKKNDD